MNRHEAILTIIAVEVGKRKHGTFVTSMARAWTVADPENKNFIRAAWGDVVDRYSLREAFSKEIEEHLSEYMNEG